MANGGDFRKSEIPVAPLLFSLGCDGIYSSRKCKLAYFRRTSCARLEPDRGEIHLARSFPI